MKITDITKQKNDPDRRSIFIDGEFAFGMESEDVYLYKLKIGEELTAERYAMLTDELAYTKAKNAAMKYLGHRARTEKEVRLKLGGEYSEETIDRVIEMLKKYRFVDDEDYARLYVKDCLELKGWGARRILDELKKRGIAKELAEPYLADTGEKMLEKAQKLLEKRVKGSISGFKEYKKQMDFLIRRGFDYQTAKEALKGFAAEDEDI